MPHYKELKVEFQADGTMDKLEVTYIDDDGDEHTKDWNEGGFEDGPASPSDDDILWGASNNLAFIKGSNCIVIGGRKYCF